MNKTEFLNDLQGALGKLPKEEMASSCRFYSEMIDDRIESGMSEEEAVASLGKPTDVAKEIMLDISPSKEEKAKNEKKKWKPWEIILLVLGSPLWVSLLISVIAIVLSLYIAVWSVVISLWAVSVALGAVFVGSIIVFCVTVANVPMTAMLYLGIGLIFAGLSVLGIVGCIKLTGLLVKLSGFIIRKIKSLFAGRRELSK